MALFYESNEKTQSPAFENLTDVDLDQNTLANGQVPVYNATTRKWENAVVDVANKFNSGNVAPIETGNTASQSYAVGSHLIWNGIYYEVIQAIAVGGALNVGVNISQNTISNEIQNLENPTVSSNEKIVGTFGDGKPIYEKYVNVNILDDSYTIHQNSKYYQTKGLGIQNIDNLIEAPLWVKQRKSGDDNIVFTGCPMAEYTYQAATNPTNNVNKCWYGRYSNSLYLQANIPDSIRYFFTLQGVFRYTKITD